MLVDGVIALRRDHHLDIVALWLAVHGGHVCSRGAGGAVHVARRLL